MVRMLLGRRVTIPHASTPPEQYLQDPMQLQHSCDLLLASELFTFHSERMCDLLLGEAQTVRGPALVPRTTFTQLRYRAPTRIAS